MSDAPTTATPTQAPASQAPSTPETPNAAATPEAPKGPSPAELRAQVLQEKLAALRERKEARGNKSKYDEQIKTLTEREKALKAQEEKWAAAYKNPLEGFKALGVAPEQLVQQFNDHFINKGTPEAEQRQMWTALKEELESLKRENPEVKELKEALQGVKAELEARKAKEREDAEQTFAREKRSREEAMIAHISQGDYEVLGRVYGPEQLLSAAYQVANALNDAGQDYSYESVGKAMLKMHNDFVAKLTPAQAKALEAEADAKEAPRAAREATAIGNDVASAAASGTERKLSPKEAREARAKKLAEVLAPIADKKV